MTCEEDFEDDVEEIDEGSTEVKAKITAHRAILLQCWHCMGFYNDGKEDCECVRCPLYPFMPYAKKEPDTEIYTYNPRKKGKVKLTPPDPEKSRLAKERFNAE